MPAAVTAGELGGLAIPVAKPATRNSPFPDPALDALGSYLKAYITAKAGEAWLQIAPGEPIVRKYFTHDPEEYDFSVTDLPALYLFPSGSNKDPESLADDLLISADKIRVFWILPPSDQFRAPHLARAMRRVAQLMMLALDEGRDPCWVVPGDSDPTAATEGSVFLRHAGLWSAKRGSWTVGRVALRPFSASHSNSQAVDRTPYDALDVTILIEEVLRALPGVDPKHPELGVFGGGPNTSPARLEATVSVGGLVAAEAKYFGDYAMLYCQDGAATQLIGTSPAKLTAFAANGAASGVQPDHQNDRFTIQQPGRYRVGLTLSATGTDGRQAEFRLRKNNTEVDGFQAFLTLGAAARSTSLYGFVICEPGDTLEIFAEADVDVTSLTVKSAQFTVEL